MHDLVQTLAQIYILREQLEDSKHAVSTYYDIGERSSMIDPFQFAFKAETG